MGTTEVSYGKNGHKNRHTPSKSDHNPPAVLPFGLVKYHIAHYAISQQDEQSSADKLGSEV
jgi:hypothetical protein